MNVFFSSSAIWVFVFLGGYLGLKRPHFRWRKKNIRKRFGKGTLHTCAKFQSLDSQKRRGQLDFVRLSAKITSWHRNYLVLAYIRFWAFKFDLMVLRSQFFDFFAGKFVHSLEHLEAAGPEKKKRVVFIPPPVTAYHYLTSLKVSDWSGHIFDASASPGSLTRNRLCDPLPLLPAWYKVLRSTSYVAFELLMHAAFVAESFWGFMPEPACRYINHCSVSHRAYQPLFRRDLHYFSR